MTTQILTGGLLLVLPITYNLLYAVLARSFGYPGILRQPTKDVLSRFAAGGSSLVLTWWGFAMTAVLLAPAVVLVSRTLADADPTIVDLATMSGVLAAAVQFLGLIRWPLVVPYLARIATDPSADGSTDAAVEVTFQALNRYLGVAVGEHLGYLFTGLWTMLVGVAVIQSDVLHPAFGVGGLVVGPLLLLGSAEFVGTFETTGWSVSAAVLPVAYVGWSVWLVALGGGLLVTS